MKIAVIGATGNLGGAVAREAATRGHEVTALSSRDVDVLDPASIKPAVAGHDAVVASVKGADHLVPRGAAALLDALPDAGVDRLLFVGGGGSLTSPEGRRFVDSPGFPPQYLETALDQAAALDLLRAADTTVDWSYVSPPPMHLVEGDKTGGYRAEATDTPLTDDQGESRISTGDFASAIVDALERRDFVRQRFTVAY
ncbi:MULTISPECIES: NAD(P)-dependent oxidoreductase [Nonomuraea]|uniref:NAD(P)-dependent oxidoreductase n=1 Tax=Nonomuraea mangrovi TaxID=2316207 RepID=A0ABW4SX17_9ACTN